MTTARVKQLLAVGIGIGAAAAAAIVLGRLADVVEATGSGANPESGFTAAVSVVDPATVRWDADAGDLFRPVDDGVRQAIAEAYLLGLALLDGDPAVAGVDPSGYLTGPALSAMGSAPSVTVDDRHHTLAVMFHSADGQIVELADRVRMTLVVGDDGRLSLTETAVVVMIQVDGTWHLRHRVVRDSAVQPITVTEGRSDSGQPAPTGSSSVVSVRRGRHATVGPAGVRAISGDRLVASRGAPAPIPSHKEETP